MELVIEYVMEGNPEPMMVLNNAPASPHVGDITPGPGGAIYRIVQRAYIVEAPNAAAAAILGTKPNRGRVVIQCVIVPIEVSEHAN